MRTLFRIELVPEENGVRIEFEGDGFLYKMVRNMVGMMVEIASGERPLSDIERAFLEKNRSFVGKAAPPNGLFLMKVLY